MWITLFVSCLLMTVSFGSSDGESQVDSPPFNLTVIVLTMNRPKSLQRLLDSLKATDFEFPNDKFDVEIHIDKTVGGLYDQTVRWVYLKHRK